MKARIKFCGIITVITMMMFLPTGCDPLYDAEWKLDKNHTPLTKNIWTNGTISSGEELWYSFIADETDNYVWWNSSGGNITVTVYNKHNYKDSNDYPPGSYYNRSPLEISRGSGQMVYVKVSGSSTFAIAYSSSSTRPGFTVTFNINGGSGTTPVAQRDINPGSSISLPAGSGFSRSGYTFGGWNTNSTGTGTNYNAGSLYTVTGNVPLYAKWNN